jgi:hypothetical protein
MPGKYQREKKGMKNKDHIRMKKMGMKNKEHIRKRKG